MGSGMADGKGMPADMAQRQQTMQRPMDTMQMMMEMTMQRMSNPPATR